MIPQFDNAEKNARPTRHPKLCQLQCEFYSVVVARMYMHAEGPEREEKVQMFRHPVRCQMFPGLGLMCLGEDARGRWSGKVE